MMVYVRWYLEYPLSYRVLVEMTQERGLKLTHTTFMRWVHQYSPIISEKVRIEQDIGLLNEKSNLCLDLTALRLPRKQSVKLNYAYD